MKVLFPAFFFAALFSEGFSQEIAYDTPTQQVKHFVVDVLGTPNKKWVVLPKLEMSSSSPELGAFATDSFSEIVKLAELKASPKPGETRPVFHVLIGTKRELELNPLASRACLVPPGKNGNRNWTNADNSLKETVVYLCIDQVGQTKAVQAKDQMPVSKDTLLKDMLRAFGFTGHSKEFDESLFSTKNHALRESLTPLDRMLISLTYKYVSPTAGVGQIWRITGEHWNKP